MDKRKGTETARKLRRDQTDVEAKLWQALRARQFTGAKFRRQVPIGPYVADFACLEERLVIELDGGQHAETMENDAMRTRFIECNGFKVIRFWNNQVTNEFEAVLESIWQALGKEGK